MSVAARALALVARWVPPPVLDRAAEEYDKTEYYLGLLGAYLDFRGARVLDVGCGFGGIATYLAERSGCRQVVGCDIAGRFLREARAFAASRADAGTVRVAAGDALKLPFADNSFDVAVSFHTLEHVPDPELALRETARVLVPGGRLGLVFPPFFSPWGHHLFDLIPLPWIHVIMSERTLVEAWLEVRRRLPNRAAFDYNVTRGPDGTYRLTGVNRLTVRQYERMLSRLPLQPILSRADRMQFRRPYLALLRPLLRWRRLREHFTYQIVAVLEKPRLAPTAGTQPASEAD